MQQAPWEKYANPNPAPTAPLAAEAGPWTKYASTPTRPDRPDRVTELTPTGQSDSTPRTPTRLMAVDADDPSLKKDYSPSEYLGYLAKRARNMIPGGELIGDTIAGRPVPVTLETIQKIRAALPGLASATGLSDLLAGKGTAQAQAFLKSLPAGILEGLTTGPPKVKRGWDEGDAGLAAEGAMETIVNTLPAIAGIPAIVKSGAKAGAQALSTPARIASLESKANANMARSIKPTTLEGQATVQRIAPELVKRDITGTGWAIDKEIAKRTEDAGSLVRKVEDRLLAERRPEFQVSTQKVLSQIDDALQKLHVRGTDATGHPSAVSKLRTLRETVAKLPDYADFDQVIQLRRQFDDAIRQGGGFNGAGSAAEKIDMLVTRGVADLLRGELNGLDDGLRAANQNYSVMQSAADIVARRKLGQVGVTGAGVPGRGTILDDILATWAGNAIGGPVGGTAAELVNLGRQTRFAASMKGKAQTAIANAMKKPGPQQKLLDRGSIPAGPFDDSAVTGVTAERAPETRAARRQQLIPERSGAGREMPPVPDDSAVTVTTGPSLQPPPVPRNMRGTLLELQATEEWRSASTFTKIQALRSLVDSGGDLAEALRKLQAPGPGF